MTPLSGTTTRVWVVRGQVHDAAQAGWFKADSRTVYLASEEFPTVEAAEAALLLNWSRNPHKARIRSINPLLDGQREPVRVTVLEEARDA